MTLVNPQPTGRNLPATSTDTRLTVDDPVQRPVRRQPVSVAYLPLGLVTFIIIAFAMAMWTFLAATS
ncbi:MAG: hypothetical protein ACXWWQ_04370 [Candidatus Limnocylindria bacterium]